MRTYAYGFPRIGRNREYKKITEEYWHSKSSEEKTRAGIDNLQDEMIATYKKYVHGFPVGETTFYDNMLDTAIMLGIYKPQNLAEYYELCRGERHLKMVKWFNTNYHYLVPDLSRLSAPDLALHWNKPKEYLEKHKEGIPYLLGPFTFLKLSRGIPQNKFDEYLMAVGDVYRNAIKGFDEVHIDEPAFVLELDKEEIKAIKQVYELISRQGEQGVKINLFTYYESVDFLNDLYDLPAKTIGLDFVHGKENYSNIRRYGFPSDKVLIAGIVDGRNIWRTSIDSSVEFLKELSHVAKHLVISNAGPLYHLPVSVKSEKNIDYRLFNKLAFAEERLHELYLISQAYDGEEGESILNREVDHSNGDSEENPADSYQDENVMKRIRSLSDKDFIKAVPYSERVRVQKEKLNLPLFPTTTIGSFPQTSEVKRMRKEFKSGKVTKEEYRTFIEKKITDAIRVQENLSLDILVHGEFERSDMVEFFAEKLNGITTTKNGWIISYGTRCYRPPIICADVSRPAPMTLDEIVFAQSLTKKPVKGMLTGPVTMIAWSFVREDIPVSEIAYQIALSLQDEIRDYEKHSIKIVQIDEPAFREKAPIKKRDWPEYFEWAVRSFNLASQSEPETQIHTHMCYSEFAEIMEYIVRMDFDVISIEASRSRGEILKRFERVKFDRQIGLGVWDVHTPVVAQPMEMKRTIERALQLIPKEQYWINPDCGLKTREWEEILPSLRNMLVVARELRQQQAV